MFHFHFQIIALTFNSINIHGRTGDCDGKEPMIEFFDGYGPTSTLLYRLCGTVSRLSEIRTKSNQMLIQYTNQYGIYCEFDIQYVFRGKFMILWHNGMLLSAKIYYHKFLSLNLSLGLHMCFKSISYGSPLVPKQDIYYHETSFHLKYTSHFLSGGRQIGIKHLAS